MNRELVLTVLALDLGGSAYVLGGIGTGAAGKWMRRRSRALDLPAEPIVELSTFELERRAWRRIWAPLWPCLGVLAFLFGWAIHEPEGGAQALPVLAFLFALPFALLAVRAALRAVRSAAAAAQVVHAKAKPLAMTVGLWRPRTLISPILRDALDDAALAAVREHEAAHVRHRDPRRVWLAQLVTDLQWPAPSARLRFSSWRAALELARDDEARSRGIDGGDLAAGLLAVARLGTAVGVEARLESLESEAPVPAGVGLATDIASQAFAQRVSRLLVGEQPEALALARQLKGARAGALGRAALQTALLTALIALGYSYGNWVVAGISGV
jgi:hypothetical protein